MKYASKSAVKLTAFQLKELPTVQRPNDATAALEQVLRMKDAACAAQRSLSVRGLTAAGGVVGRQVLARLKAELCK